MYKPHVSPQALLALALLLLCASGAAAQVPTPPHQETPPPPPRGDAHGDPRRSSNAGDPRSLAIYRDTPPNKREQVDSLLGEGRKALKAKSPDYAKAERSFNYAAHINPKEPRAYEGLGDTYEAWGRYDHAVSAYEQAVSLSPKRAEAHYKLGLLYHRLGREEDARVKSRTLRELKKKELAAKLDALLSQ
jgi:Flp pilus assembly protein TadD